MDDTPLRPLPPRYADSTNHVDWSDEVRAKRSSLQQQMRELERQEVQLLRDDALQRGLRADQLEQLRSLEGNGFVWVERIGTYGVCLAREENVGESEAEWAYRCANPWAMRADDIGCGWVRGVPDERPRNDVVSRWLGISGTRDYCRICGGLIGESDTPAASSAPVAVTG